MGKNDPISLISVEVVYAPSVSQQVVKSLQVLPNSTVGEVILQSGIVEACPDIDISKQAIGIFSKMVTLDTVVAAGDRVEIYRPLHLSPKQQRRAKVRKLSNPSLE